MNNNKIFLQNTAYRIQVINPNSSREVTDTIEESIQDLSSKMNLEIRCSQLDKAPSAIETNEDVEIAGKLINAEIKASNADAFVIACFSDPGVKQLRAKDHRNVYGIAETAMLIAALHQGNFGIISILSDSIPRHQKQVQDLGIDTRLAGDLALNLGVLELADEDKAKPRLLEVGSELKNNMYAGSIILGCAGMGKYQHWLQEKLDIPVIDPCRAAITMAAANLMTISK
ncbi:aspartate/glutamate racemase family protein [Kiloniella litopenaei]|uniref:aspartate/glutamate racemase family protein n=1 Tax=Kiloniella litopenaei TaxID=1549748 RepID=UPI003BAA567A